MADLILSNLVEVNQFHVERLNINETIMNQLSKNLLIFFTGRTRRAVEVEKTKIKRLNEKNRIALDQIA